MSCLFHLPRTSWAILIAVILPFSAVACTKKENLSEEKQKTEESKQAEIEALLKESGAGPIAKGGKNENPFAPTSTSSRSTSPSSAKSGADTENARSGENQGPGTNSKSDTKITLLNSGTGAKQALSYRFEAGRKRNVKMDMSITSSTTTNGEKGPSPPQIGMTFLGSSETLSFQGEQAQRETTILGVSADAKDLPPQLAAQMNAQFSLLKGVRLIGSVSAHGEVNDLGLKDPTQLNPAVMGLIQSLKDGMTNSFVPLPREPVGVGAKWKSENTIVATGMKITQTNEVELLSLNGSKAKVKMTFKQSAPAQELKDPRLPAEAKIQLLSLSGGGSGQMDVDLAEVLVDGNVDLKMKVQTKVSGPMVPAPQTTTAETGVTIQMGLTK